MGNSASIEKLSLPPYMISQVEAGKIVLVLGAGASMGAKHPKDLNAPSGTELAKMLAEEFLGGDHACDSLSSVADMAIAVSDERTVQRSIASHFSDFTPAPHHLLLPTFRWYGLVTLNFDQVVEKAYEEKNRPLYTIISDGDDDKLESAARDRHGTILLKLHGCVSRAEDVSVPLILTPSQYADHRISRERLFNTLTDWAADHTLIFCGTTLDDSDIHSLLKEVLAQNQGVRPRYFLVEPFASDHQVRRWNKHNIEVIPATFADFLEALDQQTGIARSVTVKEGPVPALASIGVDDATLRPELQDKFLNAFEVVDARITAPVVDANLFYKGATGDWAPILQELDCRRELNDEMLIGVFYDTNQSRPADVVVVNAEAGAGKSVFLRRLAWCAAVDEAKLCWWVNAPDLLDGDLVDAIATRITDRLYLFIDNVVGYSDTIASFVARAQKLGVPITIIGAERTNRWNTLGDVLFPYVSEKDEYELSRLTGREIRDLLALLALHGSLGYLSRLTEEEQFAEFSKAADRQLLVALHEATLGIPLEEILKNEYEQLSPELAQSIYLTVCLLNRTGTPVRAGLVSRVHGVSFEVFKERFFKPLERVVLTRETHSGRDVEYAARHPVIADIVVQQVLTSPEALFDRLVMILQCLNTLYATDQNSFRDLVKARTLLGLFSDEGMIEQVYEIAERAAPNEGHIYLQHARFETRRTAPRFYKALEYIEKAEQLLPGSPIVKHGLAELEYERAVKTSNVLEREAALQNAEKQIVDQLGKESSPHPYHTKCKIELLRLETKLGADNVEDEERINAIQRAEYAVWSGLQRWPGEQFFLDSESRLATLLDQDERALRALERAADRNLRNVMIVTRLLRLYKSRDEREKAHDLLRRACAANTAERRYHYERARLLMDEDGDAKEIELLLRKSFAEGDNNRYAQFLYARQLYINGKEDDAKNRFKNLSKKGILGSQSSADRWQWREKGKAVECLGTVSRVNRNNGFVSRHGTGEWIFVPPLADGSNVLVDLELGTRVKFNVGFNWRGPIALNVQVETRESS